MAEHRNGVSDLNVELDIGNLGDGAGGGAGVNGNQRLGTVRDRLFHAMVVKVAVSYSGHVSQKWRTLIEFLILSTAFLMLFTLVYVHFTHSRYPGTCLNKIKDTWPKKGILRVEVIKNLPEFESSLFDDFNGTTFYDPKYLLTHGPKFTPRDWRPRYTLSDLQFFFSEDNYEDGVVFEPKVQPLFQYAVEYSLSHGLLKLSQEMRRHYKVEEMTYRIDGQNDPCLSSWKNRYLTKWLSGGIGEVIQSSLKALAENETDKGYLKDLLHMEHYHFVSTSVSHYSYITAMLIMLIFTFAISMLLRFSHHQIFLFIIDLLQMFELNEPLVFPVAPLLTVILALVGMEAIMSEIFNDTSTAFYVILLVWMADQYDAICCRSTVSRKHWLRFFYLYHFAFYAYQYKFGGQYNIFALLTSAMFILHAMVFFFHHYEIPLILHQEQLLRVVGVAQQDASQRGNGELILVNRGAPSQSEQRDPMENVEPDQIPQLPQEQHLDVEIVERVAPHVFRANSAPIPTIHRNVTFTERSTQRSSPRPDLGRVSPRPPRSSTRSSPDPQPSTSNAPTQAANRIADRMVDEVLQDLFEESQH
uniref:Membralin n=1 Tax=Bursaphelenchus xylophilus TaxID=6326 RepID=A0A1I7RPL8_BURXY